MGNPNCWFSHAHLKYFPASDTTTVTDESLSQTTETEVEKVPEKNPIIIPDGLNEVRTESPTEDEAANQITAQQQSTNEEVGCSNVKLGIVVSDLIVFLAKAVHSVLTGKLEAFETDQDFSDIQEKNAP